MTKTLELPGQMALIARDELPEGSVRDTAPTTSAADSSASCYADWAASAETWILRRATEPGAFTIYDALAPAPANVRNPASAGWPGRLTAILHKDGHIAYAKDRHGTDRWDTSHRPSSARSGVRMWVGVAGSKVVAS